MWQISRFIEFFTREDAKFAIRVLDGRRVAGKKVRVMDHEVRGLLSILIHPTSCHGEMYGQSMRSEMSLRQGRNRSRASSPRRPFRYDRTWEDFYPSHLSEYSSAPRSYDGFFGDWTNLNGQRLLASPYESNDQDQRGYPCRGSADDVANLDRIDRISNRAVVHHGYYESNEYEYNPQHYYRGASFFDHRDPGYEEEIHRAGV